MDEYLKPESAFNRLLTEYRKHGSLVIGFDFDNTVHDFHKRGYTFEMVISLLQEMKEIGFKLICWTCYKDHSYVIKYLEDNNIPFDTINTDGIPLPWETRKPYFSALLDDRAGLREVYDTLTKLVNLIKQERDDSKRTEVSESL